MYSGLKRFIFVILVACMLSSMMPAALAADGFRTNDTVNFRKGPSQNTDAIRLLDPGISVEVLEHDPAGWSKVKHNGDTGYIRSDFIKYHIGSGSAEFNVLEPDGVNMRDGPSTDHKILDSLPDGTSVDVLEHDPEGWSKVRYNNVTGFIRSDFLIKAGVAKTTASNIVLKILQTADGARLRSGPSTDHTRIKTFRYGTSVEVLEELSSGWSKVRHDGDIGYISSDLLSATGPVEHVAFSEISSLLKTGVPFRVIDVRTGISFNLQCFSKGKHADVEPPTAADTEKIFNLRGKWAWDPRPVWVTFGGRTFAASLNGQPHAGSTISGNNMDGHLCLHFKNTVTNSKSYQNDLNNAVTEAWNASR